MSKNDYRVEWRNIDTGEGMLFVVTATSMKEAVAEAYGKLTEDGMGDVAEIILITKLHTCTNCQEPTDMIDKETGMCDICHHNRNTWQEDN